MPPISNADIFYLSRAGDIENAYKTGDIEVANRECRRMLQDCRLPFYYRGHFHLLLSKHDDDDPIAHAADGLKAFERMVYQSPEDPVLTPYLLYAREVFDDAQRRVEGMNAAAEAGWTDAERRVGTNTTSENGEVEGLVGKTGVPDGDKLGRFGILGGQDTDEHGEKEPATGAMGENILRKEQVPKMAMRSLNSESSLAGIKKVKCIGACACMDQREIILYAKHQRQTQQ